MVDMRAAQAASTSHQGAGLTMEDEMNLDGFVTSGAFDDTMDMVGLLVCRYCVPLNISFAQISRQQV